MPELYNHTLPTTEGVSPELNLAENWRLYSPPANEKTFQIYKKHLLCVLHVYCVCFKQIGAFYKKKRDFRLKCQGFLFRFLCFERRLVALN